MEAKMMWFIAKAKSRILNAANLFQITILQNLHTAKYKRFPF